MLRSKLNVGMQLKFRRFIFILGLIAIGTIVFSGSVTAAGLADSSWPKPGHDNFSTGQSQYKGPQTNAIKWKISTDTISELAIGNDGTIYYGSANYLHALNPNGTEKWKYKAGNYVYSPSIGYDNTIYFGSSDKKIYALNVNGNVKWIHTLKGGNSLYTDITIGKDGSLYFGSWNAQKTNNCLYALNHDGTLKWTFISGLIFGDPLIGNDGILYIGSIDGYLYALNPNGTKKWEFTPLNNSMVFYTAIGTDGTIYCHAATFDEMYYNYIFAVNRDGTEKWRYALGTDNLWSPFAIGNDGTIYIGTENNLNAFNPDGTKKWMYKTNKACRASIGSDGTIYFGDDGNIYAVNSDGKQKWSFYTSYYTNSAPVIGNDGTLYVGSTNFLYAFHDEDTKAPTAYATPIGGLYNTIKIVTLSMNEPGTIYYTLNGKIPTTNSATYNWPIVLKSNTILKFIAVDMSGNVSPVYSQQYTFDNKPPKILTTFPKDGSQTFSKHTHIQIKFSENIQRSLNWSKIRVKNGHGKNVPIHISISAKTISIKILDKGKSGSSYTLTIPKSAVKDMARNNLQGNYTFKFKIVNR